VQACFDRLVELVDGAEETYCWRWGT